MSSLRLALKLSMQEQQTHPFSKAANGGLLEEETGAVKRQAQLPTILESKRKRSNSEIADTKKVTVLKKSSQSDVVSPTGETTSGLFVHSLSFT